MISNYFREQVRQIQQKCLEDLTTREEWEQRRPQLRQQFLEMMGLWPLPERTPLEPVITGRVEVERYIIEKLYFQSLPGLYVTANLYLPKESQTSTQQRRFPAILYVCGHGNVVQDGISYGSKVHYQYHPAWFAAHGYVCLVIDTLQLGEIQGVHHGTYREKMWWWQARGYTPAGVELWNGIRALDYLESRPEVDRQRIGVTGRSGGGAYSWWLVAADDRVACAVPVAGIVDLHAQVCEGAVPRLATGVIAGHCDCMFFINTYRWDFAQVVALAAPRPVLLGNSDRDDIFPVPGYRRLADKVRKVYTLYNATDKFQLLETRGPHTDTPELRIGINRWMNRWLRNDLTTPVQDDLPPRLPPQKLKVFDQLPEKHRNQTIHESFVPQAEHRLPEKPEAVAQWWQQLRPELLRQLRQRVFGGWPSERRPLAVEMVADVRQDDLRLRAIDFTSEPAIRLRLFVLSAAEQPTQQVILSVLDEEGWQRWCTGLGSEYAAILQVAPRFRRDDKLYQQNRSVILQQKVAFAVVVPRGIGPTRWAQPGSVADTHIRRRFALLGQTVDGQRVWDVRCALAALRTCADLRQVSVTLQGERTAAGLALYAALFEPDITALDLWYLPASHREDPIFLNVLRVLDVPQALALLAPRPVTLHLSEQAQRDHWRWTLQWQQAIKQPFLQVKIVGE
jgi:dienelactone hydrolase